MMVRWLNGKCNMIVLLRVTTMPYDCGENLSPQHTCVFKKLFREGGGRGGWLD